MKHYLGKIKDFRKGQSGQALVEFAIVIPLVLVLLLGMIEWGFLLWTKMTFVNAVRDGSRSAAVMREWTSIEAENTLLTRNLVNDRLTPLPATLKAGVFDRITVELLPTTADIRSIKVSIVNQPYEPIIGFSQIIVPATLSASAEFRYEAGL